MLRLYCLVNRFGCIADFTFGVAAVVLPFVAVLQVAAYDLEALVCLSDVFHCSLKSTSSYGVRCGILRVKPPLVIIGME